MSGRRVFILACRDGGTQTLCLVTPSAISIFSPRPQSDAGMAVMTVIVGGRRGGRGDEGAEQEDNLERQRCERRSVRAGVNVCVYVPLAGS